MLARRQPVTIAVSLSDFLALIHKAVESMSIDSFYKTKQTNHHIQKRNSRLFFGHSRPFKPSMAIAHSLISKGEIRDQGLCWEVLKLTTILLASGQFQLGLV